jgi:hypothetical protein
VNGQWVTTATATHVYNTAANESISATATDANGTYSAGNTVAVQVNAPVVTPPTLSLSGAATVNVGSNYVLTLSSSSAINDAVKSWLVSWGDGTTQTVTAGAESQVNGLWVTTVTATHVYTASGSDTISATATDANGTYSAGNTMTVQATSTSPPPTPPVLALTGSTTVIRRHSYTLTLTSSDPNNDAMQEWVIHWGDGSTQTVTAGAETQVGGLWVTTISVKHSYSSAGTYKISASATDGIGTFAAGNSLAVKVYRGW